jgi:hypothetical protein
MIKLWQKRLFFEPRDVWVGVYWKRVQEREEHPDAFYDVYHVYICVLPMIPLFLCIGVQRDE